MKALIAAGVGVLALGGLLVANSGRSAAAQINTPMALASQNSSRPTLVNCGEGRQAVIWTDPRTNGLSQVECVSRDQATLPASNGYALPVSSQFTSSEVVTPLAPTIVRPAQERVVYRDRVVTRPAPRSYSRTSYTPRRSYSPVYERPSQTRSWKKSAAIIGGSTAAGAGVGAIMDGKSGAKKGAVVGLLGGTVYDIATRTRH
jgi:hypothetical protein